MLSLDIKGGNNMLYSIIEANEYFYIEIHAEEALRKEIRKEGALEEQGYYTKSLSSHVLNEIWNRFKNENNICIVLDFDRINMYTSNATTLLKKLISECVENKSKVILININNELLSMLEKDDLLSKTVRKVQNDDILVSLNVENELIEKINFLELKNSCFNKRIKDALKSMTIETKDYEEYTSTPVLLSKYIDVKKFLIEDAAFSRYCIYKLVDNLVKSRVVSKDYNQNEDITIFFHTLNGAFIGIVIADLLGLKTIFLDHLGPINRIYKRDFESKISKNHKYLVVSDVICLQSEISRAQNIIIYNSGQYIGACSLFYVNTNNKDGNSICLYEINENNNEINYTIMTSLCNACSRRCTK